MDDERSLVVEDRRLLVPTDHRPAQTRYVQHDSVVNVQVDVLHLQLNTSGAKLDIVATQTTSIAAQPAVRITKVRPQHSCRLQLVLRLSRPIRL